MDKKAFRAKIEAKIEAALTDFGKHENDKKFKKQLKKAAKTLAEGFDLQPEEVAETPPVATQKKIAAKKAGENKAAKATPKKVVKKAAVKKTAKKVKKVPKNTTPAEAAEQ